MGGVSGDFGKLAKLMRRMNSLAGVDRATAELSAGPLGGESARTYDQGADPYGNAWPATKTQGPRTLNDSGALRAGATTYVASGRRLKASIPQYGKYQRPPLFIPKSGSPPAAWTEIVEAQAEAALQKVVGGV